MLIKLRIQHLAPILLLHCMPDLDQLTSGQSASGAGGNTGVGGSTSLSGGAASNSGGTTSDGGGVRADGGIPGSSQGGNLGNAGSAGNSGASGAGAEAGTTGGGTAGSAGASAGESGHTGEGGAAGSASPPCGGCALLSVPVTTDNSVQGALVIYATPVDLSGATIVVRLRAPGATGGALQIFAQDVNYAGDYSFFQPLIEYADMTDVSYTIPPAGSSYDPTQIRQIAVQISSGSPTGVTCTLGSSCPWTQPTVLDIDSIAFVGAPGTPPGPYTFDSSAYPLQLGNYMPIAGSKISWIR